MFEYPGLFTSTSVNNCSLVRDSEPIRLLEIPTSLSLYMLIVYGAFSWAWYCTLQQILSRFPDSILVGGQSRLKLQQMYGKLEWNGNLSNSAIIQRSLTKTVSFNRY